MATTRGDAVAERAASAETARQSRETRERLTEELASIPPARAAAELQALIDGVLMDPRSGGCETIDGKFTREHCPDVASWRSELGRAQRRAEIEQQLGRLERRVLAPSARQTPAQRRSPPTSPRSASAFLRPRSPSGWCWSACSRSSSAARSPAVLVGAMDIGRRSQADRGRRRTPPARWWRSLSSAPVRQAAARRRRAHRGRGAHRGRARAGWRRIRSGSSVRAMARRIGASRGTTFNALAALLAAGVVERIAGNLVLK